ncbi:DUF2304 domain-containing protein [Paenibacillus sp. strain BS8-2]
MIPVTLQIVLFVASLIGLIGITRMISRYKLDLKYALLWIFLGSVVVLISIFPKIVGMISNLLEIETPVNGLFLLSIILILIILFNLTLALSTSHNKIKNLSQELGIYKQELIDLKAKLSYMENK